MSGNEVRQQRGRNEVTPSSRRSPTRSWTPSSRRSRRSNRTSSRRRSPSPRRSRRSNRTSSRRRSPSRRRHRTRSRTPSSRRSQSYTELVWMRMTLQYKKEVCRNVGDLTQTFLTFSRKCENIIAIIIRFIFIFHITVQRPQKTNGAIKIRRRRRRKRGKRGTRGKRGKRRQWRKRGEKLLFLLNK